MASCQNGWNEDAASAVGGMKTDDEDTRVGRRPVDHRCDFSRDTALKAWFIPFCEFGEFLQQDCFGKTTAVSCREVSEIDDCAEFADRLGAFRGHGFPGAGRRNSCG
jgi:hypothetical protein